jgi:nitroreductase
MENTDYEKLLELVKNRRTIRRFKSDPIPEDTIEKIIEVARWAPSGFNTQPWEIVVLTEEEHRKKIVELTASYWRHAVEMEKTRPDWQKKKRGMNKIKDEEKNYKNAPVYILVFGDPRTQDALPVGVQSDPSRCQLIYQSSLANFFLHLHLGSTALGLAAQWYSAIQAPYTACMIKDYLGIPQYFDVYDMIVLGYPAVAPSKKFLRKPEEFVHRGINNQGKFRSDDKVKDFVRKTRAWMKGAIAKKAKF